MLETVICWINCILDICLVLLFQALNMNKQPTGERYLNDTDSGERYLNDTDSGDPLAFL
jgi:hypothetical protein